MGTRGTEKDKIISNLWLTDGPKITALCVELCFNQRAVLQPISSSNHKLGILRKWASKNRVPQLVTDSDKFGLSDLHLLGALEKKLA